MGHWVHGTLGKTCSFLAHTQAYGLQGFKGLWVSGPPVITRGGLYGFMRLFRAFHETFLQGTISIFQVQGAFCKGPRIVKVVERFLQVSISYRRGTVAQVVWMCSLVLLDSTTRTYLFWCSSAFFFRAFYVCVCVCMCVCVLGDVGLLRTLALAS